MREVIINKNDANQRLDKFLTKYMPSLPQSMLYKSLRKKCVRVNSKHVTDGAYILNDGDVLRLYMNDDFFSNDNKNIIPTPLPQPQIIYEDENIIIADKSVGVVVHSDETEADNTLINQIRYYLYKKGEYLPQQEHSFAPSLCNRLDKNTSGLIIAAKNATSLRIINEKIKNREIKKYYLCAVEGTPPREAILTAYLERKDKHVVVTNEKTKNSKPIKTGYRVLNSNGKFSILEVELFTGRTHQIRAHLSHIGHPLLGDVKYGAKEIKNSYHQLHSYKLKFDFKTDCGILNYLNGKEFVSQKNIDFHI